MTLLRLSSIALSRSRFALSPFAETLASAMVLSRPCADPWLAAWHARHHEAFADRLVDDAFAAGLVGLLSSTKWLPDFVVIPPDGGMRTRITDELAAVASASDADVHAGLEQSLAQSWERHDLGWLSGHGWAGRAAELFGHVWRAHVAPDWARRRALLERDVTGGDALVQECHIPVL